MSFYTRNGDDGFTGILGKDRIPKYDPRTTTIGDMDEANAALGLARSLCSMPEHEELVMRIQRDLYGCMAEVAATPENAENFRVIDTGRVRWLEEKIAALESDLEIPDGFIVPGDSTASGALSVARAVVRRAERSIAGLYHDQKMANQDILKYFNRLSSLCFLMELRESLTANDESPSLAKES
jgi:cob(I)alamin adenosyltransferase